MTTASRPSRPWRHTPDVWIRAGHLKACPIELAGFTRSVAAPEGTVNITLNAHADGPLEVFVNVGRAGSDVATLAEALGRLIAFHLRPPSTVSQDERLRQVATQLRGIGGSRSVGDGAARVDRYPMRSTSMSPTTRPCHDATLVYTTATAHPPITVSAGALPLDCLHMVSRDRPPDTRRCICTEGYDHDHHSCHAPAHVPHLCDRSPECPGV